MFQEVRVDLRDKGSYDGQMLKVMKQLRCQADSTRADSACNAE